MANTDNAHGLAPIGVTLAGGPVQLFPFKKDASETGAIFANDLVTQETDGCIEANSITPGTTRYLGVNFGPYIPASSGEKICLINCDPNALFEAQCDDSSGPSAGSHSSEEGLFEEDMGLNANVVYAAGSTSTGISGTEIASSTAATTATLDLRCLRLLDIYDALTGVKNAYGDHARIVVMINKHLYNREVVGV